MRVLLVTGQLAKEMVKEYAKESKVKTSVVDLPVSVAAFLTPDYVARELRQRTIRDFDSILVPGLVGGDVTVIDEATGVPAFKGPRYAADIPVVLDLLKEVKLSKVTPACDLIRDQLRERAEREIALVEKRRTELLRKRGSMLIGKGKGSVAIGRDFPMRVVAEIADAPLLSNREIQKKARYYAELGADIIDVGMMVGESRPKDAERAIRAVKRAVKIPVSIDTMDVKEAKAAIKASADLLLSIDAGNMGELASTVRDVPVVVLPTNQRKGYSPKESVERVKALERNLRKAKKLGIKKAIGDLVLESPSIPGLVNSLIAFHDFAMRNPPIPLLFGVGNVTELTDADSIGVNALLATIASEIGVSLLFTTEGSDKTRGSVRELVKAAKMAFLAKRRKSAPKDLGLDLLILKDKRFYEEPYDRGIEKTTRTAVVKKVRESAADPLGCFKIVLDREKGMITAIHYRKGAKEPDVIIKGRTAAEVQSRIVDEGLMYTLDHAMCIGNELCKAEIALRTGKGYVQDVPLFKLFR